MEGQILRPIQRTLIVKGKLTYGESQQCWNTVKLKKDFLNEFPILKEKRSQFNYELMLHRNYEELEKKIRKMKREKLPLPILMLLLKGRVIY